MNQAGDPAPSIEAPLWQVRRPIVKVGLGSVQAQVRPRRATSASAQRWVGRVGAAASLTGLARDAPHPSGASRWQREADG